MQILQRTIFFISVTLFSYGCDDKFKTFESADITVNNNKAGTADTIVKDSILKFSFSRIKKPDGGGLNATFSITPGHQGKELYVVFSGRIRTNYAHSNSTITVAASSAKGEILAWRAVHLRYYYTDINKWCFFKDSLLLKANVDSKFYSAISAFALLGKSERENFDIDTLHVQLKEKI